MKESEETRRKEIAALLKRDEAVLYCSLGKPTALGNPRMSHRVDEYTLAVLIFRQMVREVADPGLRAECERAAQANEQILQIWESLLEESEERRSAGIRADWAAAIEDAKRRIAESEGRVKFLELEPDIRTRLCSQWHACEQVSRYEDETALSMAICDVLMTLSPPKVPWWTPPDYTLPAATLAVLVVKIGVQKFCNCPA